MTDEKKQLAILVHELTDFLHDIRHDTSVDERKLAQVAQQTYEHVRLGAINPLTDLQAHALVLLSTAPSHPALDALKWRAQGAIDMCARFAGQSPQASPEFTTISTETELPVSKDKGGSEASLSNELESEEVKGSEVLPEQFVDPDDLDF